MLLDFLWPGRFNVFMHFGGKPQTRHIIQHKFKHHVRCQTKKEKKPLSRACFWPGPLIDSHCVPNSVSRKWSTHMDSRIHRAFPRKRYKDNKLYWQTRTAKAHKRRRVGWRIYLPSLIICFPSCSYRWSPAASSIILCLRPPSLS